MSKMLEATCVGGVVTAGGFPVVAADVLSEGVGPSQGVLILDEENAKYLTSSAPDLKTTLDQVASTLSTIATALTSIGAMMTGPTTAPPPTLAADVALIQATVAQLQTLKETLR